MSILHTNWYNSSIYALSSLACTELHFVRETSSVKFTNQLKSRWEEKGLDCKKPMRVLTVLDQTCWNAIIHR